jgi:hypothetical protein
MKDYFYVLKGGAELKNVHGGDSTNKYIWSSQSPEFKLPDLKASYTVTSMKVTFNMPFQSVLKLSKTTQSHIPVP